MRQAGCAKQPMARGALPAKSPWPQPRCLPRPPFSPRRTRVSVDYWTASLIPRKENTSPRVMEASPPNPIPKLLMAPAPPVSRHRRASGLGGLPQSCLGGKDNLTLASHAAGDMAEYAPLLNYNSKCVYAAVDMIDE